MEKWVKHLADIFDGETLRIVYLDSQDKDKLEAIDQNGRKHKVTGNRLVQVYKLTTNDHDYRTAIQQLSDSIQTETVDTALLWELVSADLREYSLAELIETYYGEATSAQQGACFRYLKEDQLHFKRKGSIFWPRSKEQLEEQLRQQQLERERIEKAEKLKSYLKQLLINDTLIDVEESYAYIIPQLSSFLQTGQSNLTVDILQEIGKGSNLLDVIWNLLLRMRVIKPTDDRFLVMLGHPIHFNEQVQIAAEQVKTYTVDATRTDCTGLLSFSIDDEETQEVDDALSLERLEGGWRLGIHIADMSYFVHKDDQLDMEAQKRTSTVYMETGVVPMLPEPLSFDKASLQEGDLRPTLSLFVEFDEKGEEIRWDFSRSQITTTRRLSYMEVDAALQKGSDEDVIQAVQKMRELVIPYREARLRRGAIEILKPEFNLRVKNDSIECKFYDRLSVSRRLVSECMILINQKAAEYAMKHDVPIIYRGQDAPTEELDISLPIDTYDPVATDQMLRTLRPSRLTSVPTPHAGLGVDCYTQLSSPIRRYSDLVMQRQLASIMQGEVALYSEEELFAILASVEETEKRLKSAYQESQQYWFLRYLQQSCLEEEFAAIVVNCGVRSSTVELIQYGYRINLPIPEVCIPGTKIILAIERIEPENQVLRFRIISKEE